MAVLWGRAFFYERGTSVVTRVFVLMKVSIGELAARKSGSFPEMSRVSQRKELSFPEQSFGKQTRQKGLASAYRGTSLIRKCPLP